MDGIEAEWSRGWKVHGGRRKRDWDGRTVGWQERERRRGMDGGTVAVGRQGQVRLEGDGEQWERLIER